MIEPFPELEELINHLTSPKVVAETVKLEKRIIKEVWNLRFWETING